MAPRKRTSLPWVIVLDAMFTIFHGRRGHRRTVVDVYRRHGHLTGLDGGTIWARILYSRTLISDTVDPDTYWSLVGALVLSALNPTRFARLSDAVPAAFDIYEEIHSNPKLYMVPVEIRRMLNAMARERDGRRSANLRPPLRILLGSNQQQKWLLGLVEHHALADIFDGVYTSGSLGVRKPNEDFWNRIGVEECLPLSRMIYVGNSPGNDAPGALVTGVGGDRLESVLLLDLDGSRKSDFLRLGSQEVFARPLRELRLQYWGSARRLTDHLIQRTRRPD